MGFQIQGGETLLRRSTPRLQNCTSTNPLKCMEGVPLWLRVRPGLEKNAPNVLFDQVEADHFTVRTVVWVLIHRLNGCDCLLRHGSVAALRSATNRLPIKTLRFGLRERTDAAAGPSAAHRDEGCGLERSPTPDRPTVPAARGAILVSQAFDSIGHIDPFPLSGPPSPLPADCQVSKETQSLSFGKEKPPGVELQTPKHPERTDLIRAEAWPVPLPCPTLARPVRLEGPPPDPGPQSGGIDECDVVPGFRQHLLDTLEAPPTGGQTDGTCLRGYGEPTPPKATPKHCQQQLGLKSMEPVVVWAELLWRDDSACRKATEVAAVQHTGHCVLLHSVIHFDDWVRQGRSAAGTSISRHGTEVRATSRDCQSQWSGSRLMGSRRRKRGRTRRKERVTPDEVLSIGGLHAP